MKYSLLLATAFTCTLIANAQVKDADELVNKLEASGVLRKTGPNTLEFYISKPSDSVMLKSKYADVLKNKNGTPYEINYVVGKATKPVKKENDPTTNMNKQPVVEPTVSMIKPPPPADGSFSRIKTFGYVNVSSNENPGTRYAIYNWTVPVGVTKLKIEGWSAGGDGEAKRYARLKSGQDSMYELQGGGGGGGAYVLSFIEVKPGDELKIRIPGGGSNGSLTIEFPQSRKGHLSLTCGRNAAMEGAQIRFDGKGGRMDINTGIFSDNTFSQRGEDGEKAELLNYENSSNNVTMQHTATGAPIPGSTVDRFEYYCGDGGDAPHSMHGGRGGTIIQKVNLHGKNGGNPGGGGGGGLGNQYQKAGRGMPGFLIIYY
jgi:hypothetical protein